MVVKNDGEELRLKKGKKGWAGCIPGTEGEKMKFQELVLCLEVSRGVWMMCGGSAGDGGGNQDNHVGNLKQEQIRGPGRDQDEAAAAKCRNLVLGKVLRKRAQRPRRDFEEGKSCGDQLRKNSWTCQ